MKSQGLSPDLCSAEVIRQPQGNFLHAAALGGGVMTPDLDNIPSELKVFPQWVCYRPDKIPVNPKTGGNAKADDPETWGEFDQAVRHWQTHEGSGIAGIGFEFSPGDPYAGVDLDKCRNPETGELRYCARVILDHLASYSEDSPSGTGAHIITKAKWPRDAGNKKALPCGMKIEVYDRLRYFTVTGHHLPGTPTTIEDRQTELTALHREVFGGAQKPQAAPAGPHLALDLSDQELLDKARRATNGEKFDRLMAGDTSQHPSPSEADLSLCSILAFWTQNPGQIDRIFRASGLYRNPGRDKKWDRKTGGSTYGAKTIDKALAGTTETYGGPGGSRINSNRIPPAGTAAVDKAADEAPSPGPAMGYNLTDMGNAQRLVARHGGDLRYCYPWSKWLAWDGKRWANDNTGEVDRRAKDIPSRIYAEAAATKDKDRRKELAQFALKCEAENRRKAMIASAMSEPGIPILPDDMDRDPWLLNVLNGTVDLRTGGLQFHHKEDLITKLAQVVYDAKAECPTWWKFLERIFVKDFDLILFLQKAVGYALTGITWEQCLFFLYGLGANGKSTLLEILQALLGDYAKRTSSETFLIKKGGQIPNDIAALRGARFVAAVEVESGRRLAEVSIKEMTGGDTISARFLYSEYFEFDPEFKIFLGANHKPVIRGTDHAIWRRIHLIPFTVQIPNDEQDKELPKKLKAELPGILNWAIEGCLRWQDNGLNPPRVVQEATQGYREEMDVLADFLVECCIVAPGISVKAKDLYSAYTQWAEEAGPKKLLSQTELGVALSDRGFPRERRGHGSKWHRIGIGLREGG